MRPDRSGSGILQWDPARYTTRHQSASKSSKSTSATRLRHRRTPPLPPEDNLVLQLLALGLAPLQQRRLDLLDRCRPTFSRTQPAFLTISRYHFHHQHPLASTVSMFYSIYSSFAYIFYTVVLINECCKKYLCTPTDVEHALIEKYASLYVLYRLKHKCTIVEHVHVAVANS